MYAFYGCTNLTSVTIGPGVTSIGIGAFDTNSLTSVKFEGRISSANIANGSSGFQPAFPGDLRAKYLAGGIGTYTRPKGSNTWTKQ